MEKYKPPIHLIIRINIIYILTSLYIICFYTIIQQLYFNLHQTIQAYKKNL